MPILYFPSSYTISRLYSCSWRQCLCEASMYSLPQLLNCSIIINYALGRITRNHCFVSFWWIRSIRVILEIYVKCSKTPHFYVFSFKIKYINEVMLVCCYLWSLVFYWTFNVELYFILWSYPRHSGLRISIWGVNEFEFHTVPSKRRIRVRNSAPILAVISNVIL